MAVRPPISTARVLDHPNRQGRIRSGGIGDRDRGPAIDGTPGVRPRVKPPAHRPAHIADFAVEFDVIYELSVNFDRYSVSEKQSTIREFPTHLHTAIDRLRARADRPHKPGTVPTIACCMTWGIGELHQHPAVIRLRELKDEFDLLGTANVDAWLANEVGSIFRHSSLGISYPSPIRPQNIHISERLNSALHRLASDIGATFGTVCVISLITTLVEQSCVWEDDRAHMRKALELFSRGAEAREIAMQGAMNELVKRGKTK